MPVFRWRCKREVAVTHLAETPAMIETTFDGSYPVMTNSLLLKMTIEIVDLPIDSMVDLSSSRTVISTVSCRRVLLKVRIARLFAGC